MISTYTLAVEAYSEVSGALPATFVAPSDTPGAETYGGYQTHARRALRTLGYDVSAFPTTPVEVEDDDADNFRNLINYYALLGAVAGMSGSASEIQAGPVKIKQSNWQSTGQLLGFYRMQVSEVLGLETSNAVRVSTLTWDWEDEIDAAVADWEEEYGR